VGSEDIIFRNGQVFRDTIDRTTGSVLSSDLIRTNHARVMYPLDESKIK
jgi:vancomycin resistance protein VanW